MKKSVILLSGILFLGLASCKTKKSQTTTSTTSTATPQTYNTSTSDPKTGTQSESTTISNPSNPKASTQTETTNSSPKNATPKGTKGSVTVSENTSTSTATANPKAVTEYETSTPTSTPTKTKEVTVSETPIVYETVTDKACAVEVSFGSPGSGIDGPALDKVLALIESKKVAHTSKTVGREGERRICMPLTELKENDKKDFINQLKKIAKEGQYVSVSIR